MPEDKRNSRLNAGIFADVPAFVRGLTFADLPADVVEQARRCLLDLIGVAAAGSRTRAAQIVNDYAATQLRSSEMEARMLFDGQRASRAGGAFAGGTTIDSFDAHDGHALIKGHAGVVVLPRALPATTANSVLIAAPLAILGTSLPTRAGARRLPRELLALLERPRRMRQWARCSARMSTEIMDNSNIIFRTRRVPFALL